MSALGYALAKARQLPRTFDAMARNVFDMRAELAAVAHEIRRLVPAAPEPFVCALVEGIRVETDDSGRIEHRTFGMAGRFRAGESYLVLEATPQVSMTDVRLTVFLDLDRVIVNGMFLGTDIVTAALGECPLAFFPKCFPGQRIRVQCSRRKP